MGGGGDYFVSSITICTIVRESTLVTHCHERSVSSSTIICYDCTGMHSFLHY